LSPNYVDKLRPLNHRICISLAGANIIEVFRNNFKFLEAFYFQILPDA